MIEQNNNKEALKLLSIIVPMYNVEPYVERCIRSLENQDIEKEKYEIICINDGSPDKSKDVVLKLQKEFKNIVLIDQENQGVSMARNNGIDRAKGKYLLMIDPDDYVAQNAFASIIQYAEITSAEVNFLGFVFLNIDYSVRKSIGYPDLKNKIFEGVEAYYSARRERDTDPDRMWAVLFLRSFIVDNKLKFLANVPYLEDGECIARILCLTKRCTFNDLLFYKRTTRKGSATNSRLAISKNSIQGFLLSAKNLKKFQDSRHLSERQKRFLNQPIAKFVLLSIIPNASILKIRQFIFIKNELSIFNLIKLEKNGCDRIYSRFITVYNRSIYLFFIFWQVRKVLIAAERRLKIKDRYFLEVIFTKFDLYEKFIIRSKNHPIEEF